MISVTIPTYNRGGLIVRAIKSVLQQQYEDWELLIIDDGSTDNTEELIKPFLLDGRIRYLKKENSGAAHSRNVGVENSKGEYITFLDSDDEAKPEWLKIVAKEINEKKPAMICCGADRIDHEGFLIETVLPEAKEELFGKVQYRMTNGGVFIIRKDIFEKLGGYEKDLESGQHTELSLRVIPYLIENNLSVVNIAEPLIKIHIHQGERIRGNSKAKFLGSKRTLHLHKDFFDQRPRMKAHYTGVVAYNAAKLGLKRDALKYSFLSFRTRPSVKRFLRILKYSL